MKLFALFLALFPVLLWSESPFRAEVYVSAHTIPLDGHLEAVLTLDFPSDYSLDQVKLKSNLVSPFWLVAEKNADKKFTYTLEPVLEGKHALIFAIDFSGANKSPVTITTEPITVNVEPTANDPYFHLTAAPLTRLDVPNPIEITEENRQKLVLREKSLQDLETFQEHTFPWARVLLSLLALAAIALYLNFAQRRKVGEAPRTKESIKLLTLNAIRQLEQNMPAEQTLYQELSLVMRKYIQERYGINAPHLTTEEFLSQAASSRLIDPQSQASLKTFLQQIDLVKFGHKIPPLSEAEKSLGTARTFVERD